MVFYNFVVTTYVKKNRSCIPFPPKEGGSKKLGGAGNWGHIWPGHSATSKKETFNFSQIYPFFVFFWKPALEVTRLSCSRWSAWSRWSRCSRGWRWSRYWRSGGGPCSPILAPGSTTDPPVALLPADHVASAARLKTHRPRHTAVEAGKPARCSDQSLRSIISLKTDPCLLFPSVFRDWLELWWPKSP